MHFLAKINLWILAFIFMTSGLVHAVSPSAEISYQRGMDFAADGQFVRAKAEFQQAMSDDPSFRKAQYRLTTVKEILKENIKEESGVLLFKSIATAKKGQFDDAIEGLSRAIELNSEFEDAYQNRGLLYLLKGKAEPAIKDLTRVIRINPKNIDALLNRARAYIAAANPNLALNDYGKLIKIDPEDPEFYYRRGKVYDQNGIYEQAINDYMKALEFKPANSAAIYNDRGLIYFHRLGSTILGCADWEIACELGMCDNYLRAKKIEACF